MEKAFRKSIILGSIGLALGVYYREFTKFMGFTGVTSLSVLHTHTLIFGVFFTLLMALILDRKGKSLSDLGKDWKRFEIGLYFTLLMMFVRGNLQVLGTELSKGMDAGISGLAGVGHIILGVFFIRVLMKGKKIVEGK